MASFLISSFKYILPHSCDTSHHCYHDTIHSFTHYTSDFPAVFFRLKIIIIFFLIGTSLLITDFFTITSDTTFSNLSITCWLFLCYYNPLIFSLSFDFNYSLIVINALQPQLSHSLPQHSIHIPHLTTSCTISISSGTIIDIHQYFFWLFNLHLVSLVKYSDST